MGYCFMGRTHVTQIEPVRRPNPLMIILSFMFVILDSCIFENDITQSNSISVVVFAGRNSDTILGKNFCKKSVNNSFNPDLFSDTHTVFLSIIRLNCECVGVAKEVRIEKVILITFLWLKDVCDGCRRQFIL